MQLSPSDTVGLRASNTPSSGSSREAAVGKRERKIGVPGKGPLLQFGAEAEKFFIRRHLRIGGGLGFIRRIDAAGRPAV